MAYTSPYFTLAIENISSPYHTNHLRISPTYGGIYKVPMVCRRPEILMPGVTFLFIPVLLDPGHLNLILGSKD